MDPTGVKKVIREDSLEEFEFVDVHGYLNVDLSESPIHEVAEKAGSGLFAVLTALSSAIEHQGIVVRIPPRAVAATAVGGITGSLLGGPPGLAVGLITGAVLSYRSSSRKASNPTKQKETCTILHIFNQLTLKQKTELLKELLNCLKHSDVRSLIMEIVKNEKIRHMALDVLSGFLMKKLGISLIRPK